MGEPVIEVSIGVLDNKASEFCHKILGCGILPLHFVLLDDREGEVEVWMDQLEDFRATIADTTGSSGLSVLTL